ncbi:hypothetical protein MNBD_DELTA01-1643, partial [hydrothermal vent metagenome]
MIKVIVFDFDGTIVDSNQLKYDAFFDIFPQDDRWQGIVKDVLDEFRERTRGFIVEQVLRDYETRTSSKIDGFQEQADSYVKKYGEAVESGAIRCEEISGAKKTLETLSVDYPLYINSATQIDSLERIIEARALSPFFRRIYGAPELKSTNLTTIFLLERVSAREVLVVGDGYSDLESAREHGCEFIGIRNEFNRFNVRDLVILDDLEGLKGLIENKMK